ncbi:adenylyl-sulfate kinase [Aquabacterium sp.]|uniref:adenylyl-sulfate kinase n=1 Tax=Aquabacterium sp. TaxID=1872578 RepID=UPI0024880AED|nr:adenylyl-sulfate kinase [Aquabacterium sp.]MDI1260540.1 adenylyl-sulfate kinase [Aquabacterium sp.]
MQKNPDITTVAHQLDRNARRQRHGHDGAVIWLTGLSAAGKSTLAMGLEADLARLGYACYALDGDNVREGLNANLGFSPQDRAENIRRVGEVAALFADAGLICITAFISPYRADRDRARLAVGSRHFHEVHVAASLAVCEGRDPKGLYRKARRGDLPEFTGIDAPYEAPLNAELVLDTGAHGVQVSAEQLLAYVVKRLPLSGQRASD